MKHAIPTAAFGIAMLSLPLPAQADAARDAQPATQENYVDAQVARFAAAAVEVNRIARDPALSSGEKTPKVIAAIEKQGLDLRTFNSIARASRKNSSLKRKIDAAIALRS